MQHAGVPCFGYVFQEQDKATKVDPVKMKALGINGPLVGRLLKDGQITLTNPDQTTRVVTIDEVVLPLIPGRKVVLLGDTSDPSAVLSRGKGCSLLVHECTLDGSKEQLAIERGHSTSVMAGKFAHLINARSLILTHFSPRYFGGGDGDLTVEHLRVEAAQVSLLIIQS